MLKIAFDSIYAHPLPEGHRFPMIKYELIPEQLLHEGSINTLNLFNPTALDESTILLTHDQEYWKKLKTLSLTPAEVRRTGFPLSEELVRREVVIAKGTIDCALFAMKYGVAMNVAGGTHHAFTNKGEGFCLLNDIAIAANYLLTKYLAKKILVIDLDVHQGNGTAEIFQNNSSVFTFSMHGKSNFPYKKERSDLDIELPDKTNDTLYLGLLKETLPRLIQHQEPDFIFYLSGVDILETDKLGKLAVSKSGCKERDRFVFEYCKKNNIPVAVSMGGGYSPKITDIIDAHCNTFRLANELYF
ncbi:histone deacetylase family protein [Solitalea koreensis]|uniref:Acetoin utilization deacetylase AcuC n=1 Tax=Solitalea koreensis TaxID=543615 RepID=A0A521BDT7_9SPHI|nr:histone deacetylase [Solitalea koreensis]SMO45278.1 Acetoin utilization deacetylase AcuC [Solitalea koreensis]